MIGRRGGEAVATSTNVNSKETRVHLDAKITELDSNAVVQEVSSHSEEGKQKRTFHYKNV